jgi:hypothetical protein
MQADESQRAGEGRGPGQPGRAEPGVGPTIRTAEERERVAAERELIAQERERIAEEREEVARGA